MCFVLVLVGFVFKFFKKISGLYLETSCLIIQKTLNDYYIKLLSISFCIQEAVFLSVIVLFTSLG